MPRLAPLLDCLLPDDCPGCGGPRGVAGLTSFCRDCDAHLPRGIRMAQPPGAMRSAWVLGPYAGPLGAAVRRAKYRPDPGLAGELAQRLASGAADRLPAVDEVVHVPVPWRRRLSRGFDQAAVLAAAVSEMLDKPHVDRLKRREHTEQAGRDTRHRHLGARRAYVYRWASGQPGQRILLVDDVVTTGATAAACTDELLNAGASEVHLLCVAASRG